MAKKLSKRRAAVKKKSGLFGRGKSSAGVMTVLGVIGVFSAAMVFGLQQLSPYSTSTPASYECCDSGSGEACVPNTQVPLVVNVNGVDTTYYLLKTGVKLPEGSHHIAPIEPNNYISGIATGQYVYVNTISDYEDQQRKYVVEGAEKECKLHGTATLANMDTIQAGNLPERCEKIPNDEIVYLCAKGCEDSYRVGENGIFNAYFRASDTVESGGPGIPYSVKYCETPIEAQVQRSSQRIINLPSPSGKPDLQLETFYIENDDVVANWVTPWCKPAIYLYPTEKTAVNVQVNPAGEMLTTIPSYPAGGWNVTAYPNGDIYHNNTRFDYLFYEASIPDEKVELPKEGYVVAYDSLGAFLPDLVTKLGLNEKEQQKFTEYWLKQLPESPYYQVKVVSTVTLGKISPLFVTPSPKTRIRVTLHFTPFEKSVNLPEPQLVTPLRDGFTVVEWGGIFKTDGKHSFSCLM